MTSKHLENDRQGRMALIAKIGYGKPVASIELDDGHRDGPKQETLSTTGIITVRNVRSRKVVTYLIARPGQLKRFFADTVPEYLVEIAREHQRLGYHRA